MHLVQTLVVDDEPDVLVLLRSLLKSFPLHVTTAGSAQEALEAVERHPCDLLITDILMDAPGGLKLAERVRRRHPETDVILITGYQTADSLANAMKVGAYDYLAKPFDILLLKAAVRRCLERRALRAQLDEGSAAAHRLAKGAHQLSRVVARLREAGKEGSAADWKTAHDLAANLDKALPALERKLHPAAPHRPATVKSSGAPNALEA